MKKIDAVWEKRNLNVSAIEIVLEETDTVEQIEEEFCSIEAQYMVVKVPSFKSDLSDYVQKKGFIYVEDLIGVEHDLHDVQRSPLHQRLYDASSYRRMEPEDIDILFEEIEMGMFQNDRISKDASFGIELAANRYKNWIKDLIKQGASLYSILYKDDPIGFVILQTKDQKSYTSVLGGGYHKYRNTGLGIIQKEQEIVRNLGGKKVETNVSSNNPSQLRALMMNGYIPGKIEHVFVKHVE